MASQRKEDLSKEMNIKKDVKGREQEGSNLKENLPRKADFSEQERSDLKGEERLGEGTSEKPSTFESERAEGAKSLGAGMGGANLPKKDIDRKEVKDLGSESKDVGKLGQEKVEGREYLGKDYKGGLQKEAEREKERDKPLSGAEGDISGAKV